MTSGSPSGVQKRWRGCRLDSVETAMGLAETLTFKGKQPTVSWVKQTYNTNAPTIWSLWKREDAVRIGYKAWG
ncbi:hypothetical protein IQ254_26205 [Nodosilinea sp. LEGE 07088]|uniref:hypothetical protein n=1 Tax=Nodosilinea sp. LEGE 07088 TaxID=2777968 RepID=UPI00187DE3DC|nr:hypothetical protein [Nodosilinea sp. LEGE 07088]MBE9140652.1 hypothetical protein [Nodosilinea sp. LEGE 07088]